MLGPAFQQKGRMFQRFNQVFRQLSPTSAGSGGMENHDSAVAAQPGFSPRHDPALVMDVIGKAIHGGTHGHNRLQGSGARAAICNPLNPPN